MSEMTFEDAVQALDAAQAADEAAGVNPFDTSDAPPPAVTPPSKPEETSSPEGSADPAATPEETPAPAQPRDEQGRFAPADSEPSFMERADLEALLNGVEDASARERIEAAYKSFQRGFTQARQREAEIVRGYEQLGSMDDLQQLAQLRQSLQQPENLVALYGEIQEHLAREGFLPAPTGMPTQPAMPAAPDSALPDFGEIEDPDLQPFKQAFEGLRTELDQLRAEREEEARVMEAQRLNDAILGELQRQENIIRQTSPHYTDEDINAVYELASYFDGNLLQAQSRLEEIVNGRLERYLAGKASAAEATSPVIPNLPNAPATPDARPGDLDAAHEAAMEALRHIEAQDS